MGLIVDKGALHRAIDDSCKTINAQNQQLRQISSACDGLNGENQLTGQAWQAAKQQADTLGRQINDALAYNQAVLDDHRTLATLLDQYIDDDFIAEDAVTQALGCLHQVDQAIEAVRDLLPPITSNLVGPAINDLLDQDRRTGQWLQDKIDRLRQFDQATSTLYGGDKVGADGNKDWIYHHRAWQFLQDDDKDKKGVRTDDPQNRDYELPLNLLDGPQPTADDFDQGQIGDCWLISTLKAMADAGYDIRKGIKKTKDGKHYIVTLFDNGTPVQVEVDYIYYNGAGGVAGLWEAAIRKQFGRGALNGGQPNWAWEAITGKKPLKVDVNDGSKDISTQTLKSKGSKPTTDEGKTGDKKGTISVADSKPSYTKKDGQTGSKDNELVVSATDGTKLPGNGYRVGIEPKHAYEVVETKGDMICLRNPWGYNYWFDKDGDETSDNGEPFWISRTDFDKAFNAESQQ
ncbi:C2 family cysteine protease [Bifidobacterium sp. ESL0728]|uniref:C2 family cysteine protease n=1 Tax=Bifidobacterium sp. ESL0728 TaxID=2983220 RepID=UPI0023F74563|nr:C2 family cysteine protease [Bifidobacterium sp. ESL0728]WEV58978.1 C2 family cysteine protease [Bifidobacterium sp. ESL0728]